MNNRWSFLPCMNHYLKFCILRSVLLTQFRKFLLPTLYKYRGDVEINTISSPKRLFSLQNEQYLTYTTTPCWLEWWSVLDTAMMWMATSRKQVTHRRCITVFSSCADSATWTGFYTVCQLWFTKMCECLLYTNDHVSASPTVFLTLMPVTCKRYRFG